MDKRAGTSQKRTCQLKGAHRLPEKLALQRCIHFLSPESVNITLYGKRKLNEPSLQVHMSLQERDRESFDADTHSTGDI